MSAPFRGFPADVAVGYTLYERGTREMYEFDGSKWMQVERGEGTVAVDQRDHTAYVRKNGEWRGVVGRGAFPPVNPIDFAKWEVPTSGQVLHWYRGQWLELRY